MLRLNIRIHLHAEAMMRIVRFMADKAAKCGVLEGDAIRGVRGSMFSWGRRAGDAAPFDGSSYALREVRLLPPVSPSKIVAVGLNYRGHALEWKLEMPSAPLIFLKPSTSVIGPGDAIVRPRGSRRVDYEGELAVIMGRKAKDIPRGRANEYILGYTCGNDVSERHMQKADGQWTRAKGFDTFAPLGPWTETELDPGDLRLATSVNGVVRQTGSTSDMVFSVPELIEFISGVMTLLPGDVIMTGTPAGVGPIEAGDVVEVAIDGIGTLRNPVAQA